MADLKRFFKKTVSEDRHKQAASVSVPEGLWIKCPKCGEMVYREDVISNAYVCPKCGGYFRISAKRRIKMIADKGSFKEWFTGIDNSNPLDYPDYPQKIEDLREKTHLDEAILIGEATIGGIRTVIGAMDTRFLMASMGYVVGEKITRSFEEATKQGLPGRASLHICADRPDYRWRYSKLCHAWRYYPCRTRLTDRICRPESH